MGEGGMCQEMPFAVGTLQRGSAPGLFKYDHTWVPDCWQASLLISSLENHNHFHGKTTHVLSISTWLRHIGMVTGKLRMEIDLSIEEPAHSTSVRYNPISQAYDGSRNCDKLSRVQAKASASKAVFSAASHSRAVFWP